MAMMNFMHTICKSNWKKAIFFSVNTKKSLNLSLVHYRNWTHVLLHGCPVKSILKWFVCSKMLYSQCRLLFSHRPSKVNVLDPIGKNSWHESEFIVLATVLQIEMHQCRGAATSWALYCYNSPHNKMLVYLFRFLVQINAAPRIRK